MDMKDLVANMIEQPLDTLWLKLFLYQLLKITVDLVVYKNRQKKAVESSEVLRYYFAKVNPFCSRIIYVLTYYSFLTTS